MKTKRNVLIVTDGSAETGKFAAEIASALQDDEVSSKAASEFAGNDILPAKVFFLGCQEPAPDSFAYITDLFKHINLAGRTCGLFCSGSERAAEYLTDLVKDCDAAINIYPFLAGNEISPKNWAQNVISRAF